MSDIKKENLKKQSFKFEMKPLAFEEMGEKLIRVTCYLLGTGPNANFSNITRLAVEQANSGLAHLPVVGHLMQTETGEFYLGGHDYTINDNWEIEPLTVPLGCVAGDCEFVFEDVVEPNGETREYLKVEMILWNHLSPIFRAAYNDNVYFNHSIELDKISGEFDSTNNYRIDSFEYDRACLLGLNPEDGTKNVTPCFPSAQVFPFKYSKHVDFNALFSLLMQEIDKTKAEAPPQPAEPEQPEQTPTHTVPEGDDVEQVAENKNHNKEEDTELKKIIFSELCGRLKEMIGEHVFNHSGSAKQYAKYATILSISDTDKTITVVDREGYSIKKIPFAATQTDEGLHVTIDYDNAAILMFGATEKPEESFNVNEEILMISRDVSEFDVKHHVNGRISELEGELATITADYGAATERIAELEGYISVYEKEKETFKVNKKKEMIDVLIASRRVEMGKDPEFLAYCVEDNYAKEVDRVEKELREIHYSFLQKNSPSAKGNGKMNFSAHKTTDVNGLDSDARNIIAERYGADIAKFF